MSLKEYRINNNINLLLDGDFDAAVVQELRPTFENVVSIAEDDVIVDLSNVEFIDSSGIGVLVFLFKRLREKNIELIFVGLTGQPKRLVEMLRIDKTIKSFTNLTSYLDYNAELKTVRAGA